MDRDLERAALVALLRRKVNARRWRQVTDTVEDVGSAMAVLQGQRSTSCTRQMELFPDDAATEYEDVDHVAREILDWERDGTRLLTVLDEDYPVNLRTVFDRPPLVFVRGEFAPADSRSVAVVGTRKASPEGLARAGRLARELVKAGVTVVSGLAAGIDTAALTAALAAGGRTLAVIGTGIRNYYPPGNRQLQDEIAARGVVLSQFWPDDPPARFRFPMRNAVMSGLALATVIIEASETSGSKIQAEQALKHNRPVFLLRSLLAHPWAQGFARRPGVTVLDTVDDVLEKLEQRLNPRFDDELLTA